MESRWVLLVLAFGCVFGRIYASEGESDPLYRACVDQCEKTGSIGANSIQQCKFLADDAPVNSPWYMQEPTYLRWKQWNCQGECRYHCMMQREREREALGLGPIKYHGKWPFKHVFVFQEPVSAALSTLTLVLQFNGWLSFCLLLYYKLPLRRRTRTPYYDFTSLWHVYGLLSMNAAFWSAIFHSRNFELIELLDCCSAVAFLGYSLILAILRTCNVKVEASRVMIAAPLLGFLMTHILFLSFVELQHWLNKRVRIVMGTAQLLFWAVWAATRHPSSFKLWLVVIIGAISMLLEIYDFPPYGGYVDSHALWHALEIPLTSLWWSIAKEDADIRTSAARTFEVQQSSRKRGKAAAESLSFQLTKENID